MEAKDSNAEINLIPPEAVKEEPAEIWLSRLRKIGRILLVTVDLFLIFVFVLRFRFSTEIAKIGSSIEEKNQEVLAKSSFEKDFLTMQNRLAVLSVSYKAIEKKLPLLSFVEEKVPLDLSLTRLALATDGNLIITGTAVNYAAVAQLTDSLRSDGRFYNLTILSLGRDEKTQTINFSLQVHLGALPSPTPTPS